MWPRYFRRGSRSDLRSIWLALHVDTERPAPVGLRQNRGHRLAPGRPLAALHQISDRFNAAEVLGQSLELAWLSDPQELPNMRARSGQDSLSGPTRRHATTQLVIRGSPSAEEGEHLFVVRM